MAYHSTSFMFKSLTDAEEEEFRQWPHEHPGDMADAVRDGNDGLFHPVIRDEWEKMQSTPNGCEALAAGLERDGRYDAAAKVWRRAAGLSMGHNRAARYEEAASACDTKHVEESR